MELRLSHFVITLFLVGCFLPQGEGEGSQTSVEIVNKEIRAVKSVLFVLLQRMRRYDTQMITLRKEVKDLVKIRRQKLLNRFQESQAAKFQAYLDDLKKLTANNGTGDVNFNNKQHEDQIKKNAELIAALQKKLEVILAAIKANTKTGKDCADLYKNGVKLSGVYVITPADQNGSIEVYCDMVTDGGGWTVFQRRQDGSVDFYRGWTDYKLGFGNLNGEFWLGNDDLHRLTNQGRQQLRVDMEDTSGTSVYASYDMFAISDENTNYKLSLGSYSGNAGDSLSYQNGRPFSTKDREHGNNCAVTYKGAWWYNGCHHSNLNGLYHHGAHDSFADGVNWKHFKGYNYSLKKTSMKIRPGGF